MEPTPSQQEARDYRGLSLLIVAPAGCGKTEALAMRVQGLLERRDVQTPRRILAVTFTNRSRDNMRDRLRSHVPQRDMFRLVTFVNFHGLATRIFQAHANVIGLSPDMTMPETDWVRDQCKARNLGFKKSDTVQKLLQSLKLQPLTDAEIDDKLEENGNLYALEIERQRLAEERLTYDDLLRLAELILANDKVAQLYRDHFGAVIVDEFQDLTPQQLRIINRIGYGKTTYAGDLAQGIYSFAGARPNEIYQQIQAECPKTIEFSESYRSSPAVLAAVNSLNSLTGGKTLTPAQPESWPDDGFAGGIEFSNDHQEADWLLEQCQRILNGSPNKRIGIATRSKLRRKVIDSVFEASGIAPYRWDDPLVDTDTADRMRMMLNHLSLAEFYVAPDKQQWLAQLAQIELIQDPKDRSNLLEAINWCTDLLRQGKGPEEISKRITIGDDSTLLTKPGVHLITGHIGKGQQFDWMIVAGLEEETLPDWRSVDEEQVAEEARILSVMLSRARYGVLITYCKELSTRRGVTKKGSRFLEQLETANLRTGKDAVEWFSNMKEHKDT